MLFFRGHSAQHFLAFDLGSSALKVLAVKPQRAAPLVITDFCITPSTLEASSTAHDIAPALAAAARQLNPNVRTARLALSSKHAIVRVIDMPVSSRDEVQRVLSLQLTRYVPLHPDEAAFDFVPLPQSPGREARPKILLVALRRTVVESYNAAARAAGLDALLIDVEPLAALNALLALRPAFDRSAGVPYVPSLNGVLVHFGARHTDLCILRDGVLAACRTLESGHAELARELAAVKQIDAHAAAALLRPDTKPDPTLRPCFDRFVRRIADELHISFDFLRRECDFSCDRIYLTGGAADCPSLPALLEQATNIPCVRFDPLLSCNLDALETRIADLRDHAATFAPAIGLAIRPLKLP